MLGLRQPYIIVTRLDGWVTGRPTGSCVLWSLASGSCVIWSTDPWCFRVWPVDHDPITSRANQYPLKSVCKNIYMFVGCWFFFVNFYVGRVGWWVKISPERLSCRAFVSSARRLRVSQCIGWLSGFICATWRQVTKSTFLPWRRSMMHLDGLTTTNYITRLKYDILPFGKGYKFQTKVFLTISYRLGCIKRYKANLVLKQ